MGGSDAVKSADPGVASVIPARSHSFMEIDHEIIYYGHSSLPLINSRRVVVRYKRKMCTNYWLTSCSSLLRKSVVI